jgi:hypothetical protein
LPTHFVVYPEWLQNDVLLGERLTEREVAATILGGPRMVAYVANYSALSTAELPSSSKSPTEIVDRLDVADLESESAHDYRLFSGNRETNRIFVKGHRADGGRTHRTREQFRLQLAGECALVLRVASDAEIELAVFVERTQVGSVSTNAELGWEEHRVAVPETYCWGTHAIEVSSPTGTPFAALSYWSLRQKPAAPPP